MNSSYLELTYGQIALAASLILINGVISVALQLRMERSLFIASLRTVVQLLLIGMILEWVFQMDRWYIVISLFIVMTCIAGATAAQSVERRYRGLWFDTILAVWASSWAVLLFALFFILRGINHWYEPQYSIPFLGMLLGNTLNGICLGLGAFTDSLVNAREQVESKLTCGATRWEAAREPIQNATRVGMIPIINSMMIVGIVSLPGMMTGQILSGTSPIEAVKYQVVIMFMIATATALGLVFVILLSYRRLFNSDHQFIFERIYEAKK